MGRRSEMIPGMPAPTGASHAVVIGASMAGLTMAKALTTGFDQVTVLDRDQLPHGAVHRAGVPQDRHLHVVLPAGAEALESLLPGLTDDMVAGGAPTGELAERGRLYFSGHRLARCRTGHDVVFASRPFVEEHVRRRLRDDSAVRLWERCEVRRPVGDARRVIGVEVVPRGGGGEQILEADVVVDCSGRRSVLPEWLEQLGCNAPPREELQVNLRYATRHYRVPGHVLEDELGLLVGPLPDRPRAAVMLRVEGDRWMVTLAGWGADKPPLDPEGYEAFAARLAVTDLHDVLRRAEPLDEPRGFRYPASVRHRYELLDDLPGGLLAAGDAVSSFDPVYGQGMTVAAQEAMAMCRQLEQGSLPSPSSWFRFLASIVDAPWHLAITADLFLDCVDAPRSLRTRISNAYSARLHAAAAHDPHLSMRLQRVIGLLDPPARLARPGTLVRVLRGALRRGAGPRAGGRPADPGTTSMPGEH
jgi:2-polyprenyl-6-methoxyphenol hydroxylase-like FAD-dependent oxidoreductase